MATIPNWPDSLPAPRLTPYQYQEVDPNARTNMDAGNRRVRRRFISTPTDVQLTWRFTSAQLATFDNFFANAALAGSAWCSLPIVNGQGVKMVRSRFSGMPQRQGVDGATDLFDVSITAEVSAMAVAPNG